MVSPGQKTEPLILPLEGKHCGFAKPLAFAVDDLLGPRTQVEHNRRHRHNKIPSLGAARRSILSPATLLWITRMHAQSINPGGHWLTFLFELFAVAAPTCLPAGSALE